MHLSLFRAALVAVTLATSAAAQGLQVYNFDSPRHASNMVLFGANVAAGMTIVHGQPQWKKEYDGMQDMLKGKTHRLGKDLWTTFMTSAPVELGGVKVAPGCYCVGLHCDKAGKFALAMMDATRAMKKSLMPFGPQNWKPEVVVPLKFEKGANKKLAEKMVISLIGDKDDKMKGLIRLSWGNHYLSAPVKVHAPNK